MLQQVSLGGEEGFPRGSSIVLLNSSGGAGRRKGIRSLSGSGHMPHSAWSAGQAVSSPCGADGNKPIGTRQVHSSEQSKSTGVLAEEKAK